MSWYHTHLILPLAERDRYAGLSGRLRAIRRFENMPEQAQRAEHRQRLQRLLQHAYDTVPFYRRRFDEAGFDPSAVPPDGALPLPVLTRDDLQHRGEELVSNAFPKSQLRTAATGGTTGLPASFRRDLEALRNKMALQQQLNAWAGYKIGDSVLLLWGAPHDLTLQPNWRWRFYEQTLLRRIPATSGLINKEVLERFRQSYESHRPKIIYGYTSLVVAFAAYLKERGFRHRPQSVIVTADPLSDTGRRQIESAFQVPVFDHYGSRDIGMIASECSTHHGMHFHPWCSSVEFDPIGDTTEGPAYRLLVTDLLNYGQPFVRYDTGDCVTLSEERCGCGRWFPTARRILGRASEGIVLADGGIVPGMQLTIYIEEMMERSFRSIAQVQFVQKSLGHLHMRYEVKEVNEFTQSELSAIRGAIDSMIDPPMTWSFEHVREIPRERSGKLRLCISEISAPESSFSNSVMMREEPEAAVHAAS